MRRFRTQWLALFGALVILSMSLSTAFGAKPTTTTSPFQNFGQQVSAFVHALLADNDEDGDEDSDEDPDADQDEDSDEDSDEDQDEDSDEDSDEDQDEDSDECETPSDDGDTEDGDTEDGDAEDGDTEDGADCDEGDQDEDSDEDSDEDADEDSEDGDGTADEDSEFKNHGQCVAEVARSGDVGENGTHGWAVALAAQVTCWLELNGDDEEDEDEADSDSASDTDEEVDADASSTEKTHGKSEAAHQRKMDRGKGRPDWVTAKLQDRGAKVHGPSGHGHGKGHGRH